MQSWKGWRLSVINAPTKLLIINHSNWIDTSINQSANRQRYHQHVVTFCCQESINTVHCMATVCAPSIKCVISADSRHPNLQQKRSIFCQPFQDRSLVLGANHSKWLELFVVCPENGAAVLLSKGFNKRSIFWPTLSGPAVPYSGQTTWNSRGLSPKWYRSSKAFEKPSMFWLTTL